MSSRRSVRIGCTPRCSVDLDSHANGGPLLPNLEMVDQVRLPASLQPGRYVLQWRWDCEEVRHTPISRQRQQQRLRTDTTAFAIAGKRLFNAGKIAARQALYRVQPAMWDLFFLHSQAYIRAANIRQNNHQTAPPAPILPAPALPAPIS